MSHYCVHPVHAAPTLPHCASRLRCCRCCCRCRCRSCGESLGGTQAARAYSPCIAACTCRQHMNGRVRRVWTGSSASVQRCCSPHSRRLAMHYCACQPTVSVPAAHLLDVLLHLRNVIRYRPATIAAPVVNLIVLCDFAICRSMPQGPTISIAMHVKCGSTLGSSVLCSIGCAPQQEHRLQQRSEVRSPRSRTRRHQSAVDATTRMSMYDAYDAAAGTCLRRQLAVPASSDHPSNIQLRRLTVALPPP
jgi:hypothetical protein